MTKYLRAAAALLLAIIVVVGVSCGDDKPAQNQDVGTKDAGQKDLPAQNDITVDTNQQQDVWPSDLSPDVWPQNDTYGGGAPFGCLNDTDCFGQKCCPTPWGVRMCAASCGN